MSYVKIVDYAAKDALLTGNPAKVIKGTELGAEFDAIATASATTDANVALKLPLTGGTVTGNVIIQGNTTLGDASGDTLTVASSAVTWSNNPTHSGNHTISGTLAVNGNTTLGNASTDSVTANGNTFGIGTAPSAWTSAASAIDLNTIGAVEASTAGIYTILNLYHDGTNWRYKTTGPAAYVELINGDIQFVTVPSGTAGSVATPSLNVAIPNVASAVNYLKINAAATGNAISLDATGTDTNISTSIKPKGGGDLYVQPYAGTVTSFNVGPTGSSDVNYLRAVSAPTGTAASLRVVAGGTNKDLELTPASGGAVVPTTGQIRFPATQNASANANTLDDYEEGTWTPSVGGTATYATQSGKYTKTGNLVSISCRLIISSIGTGSTVQISGLPFTSSSSYGSAMAVGYFSSLASSVVGIFPIVNNGDTTINIYSTIAAATAPASNAIFGNSADIHLAGFYFI